jgi:hypothetical protein
MSGTNAGHQPHTNQEVTPSQKPSDDDRGPDVPSGYEVDHHDPDEFSVRCTSCGHLETYSSRARAHRKADHHGLECSSTGVTPLTELDAATDGGQSTDETKHRIQQRGVDEGWLGKHSVTPTCSTSLHSNKREALSNTCSVEPRTDQG